MDTTNQPTTDPLRQVQEPVLAAETWAPIVGPVDGFNGRYEVSTLGRVRRISGPLCGLLWPLKSWLSKGYPMVELSLGYRKRKRISVHRLVAHAFLGPKPHMHHIDHIDGDRTNNRLINLEYVTQGENNKRAAMRRRTKVSLIALNQLRRLADMGMTNRDLAMRYGVSFHTIKKLKAGRAWIYANGGQS